MTIRVKNTDETTTTEILTQFAEPRALPMGRTDFEEWSDRIISGALIPGATVDSQKFALANMLTHLGQTESHKPDAFFIHGLRVFAIKQLGVEIAQELHKARKAQEDSISKAVPDIATIGAN